ncbi:hypothetical protein BKA61DRAFT_675449 [Leptodontidium sp. MPI-SDFR-AT-0119]|nr:hypothetical protein BKA61DRAFT_675449 [Leptodontidium sp. MPI-SDFR-AT-0119]
MASTQILDPDGDLIFTLPGVPPKDAEPAEDPEPARKRSKSNRPIKTSQKAPDVRMQVSAKHMNGKVEIPLPDDDPATFTILLDIIHGRGRRVPRVIDLETFTILAVAIDKYQLHDVTEVCFDVWLSNTDEWGDDMGLDPELDACELYRPLTISWIFQQPTMFRSITSVIICGDKWLDLSAETKVPGTSQILPIPSVVLEGIRTQREQFIADLYAGLDSQIRKYTSLTNFGMKTPSICKASNDCKKNRECDALVLGSLMQSISKNISVWPDPGPPYDDSFCNLSHQIQSLEIFSRCDGVSECCREKNECKRIVYINRFYLEGLYLSDFPIGRGS